MAATLSITNNDGDEAPYHFDLTGSGSAPEMDVQGNSVSIVDGDTTPNAADDTSFGAQSVAGGTVSKTFTIQNTGTETLTLGSNAVSISGANASDFTVATQPATTVAAGGSTTFTVEFAPSAVGAVLSSQIRARINQLSLRNGDSFSKGDVLIRFDCTVLVAERERASAEHRAATRVRESNRRLSKHKAVGILELELSELRVDKTSSELKLARSRVQLCTLRAPHDGRLVKRHVNAHESVTEDQPLLEILDDRSLEVLINVPSNWLAWLTIGTQFDLSIDETGQNYPAQVVRLGSRVDAVSQSLEISAQLEGSMQGLIAGMSGFASFSLP